MISSGTFGVILLVATLVTIVSPTSTSRSVTDSVNPGDLTDESIKIAIDRSLEYYNSRTAKRPYEAALLVAMTIHDLYSNVTANYDEPMWMTVVKWLRRCGVHLPYVDFCHNGNLTTSKLDQQFSVRNRSVKFGNFHSDIDQLDYQQVVMKWRDEMEKAPDSLPKLNKYQRKVELLVSILPKWEQMVLIGSYFEHFTLPKLLKPWHSDVGLFDYPSRMVYTHPSVRYYNDMDQAAQVHSRVTNMSASINWANHPTPEYYHQEMVIPEEIVHLVRLTNIPVRTNSDGHLVMFYGDALEWIVRDYVQYLIGSAAFNVNDKIDSRKIVHYFNVIKQSKLPKPVTVMQANSAEAQKAIAYFFPIMIIFSFFVQFA